MAAVFLSLALGILIGVSFGDSFLAANQRDVVQLMELRLVQLKEEMSLRELELQRWSRLEPLIRRRYDGALAGKEIFLISPAKRDYSAVETILGEAGADVTVGLLPAPGGDGENEGKPPVGEGKIAAILAGSGVNAGDLLKTGMIFPGLNEPRLDHPPHWCLLLLEREEFTGEHFFSELAAALYRKGLGVILLLPWRGEEGDLHLAGQEGLSGMVDNIDTFWGQIALLEMIAGGSGGHYGFGKSSSGLLPAEALEY